MLVSPFLKGKFTEGRIYHLSNKQFIWCLEEQKTYKYVASMKNININGKELKPNK